MPRRPALSKGEMEVARALWQLRKGTVREVFEAVQKTRKIDFTTVQTYLRRLESKGYVRAILDGRTKVYSTRVKPGTVIRETIDDLVDRLFGGEAFPLMQHLIEQQELSPEQLARLRRMIDSQEPTGTQDPDGVGL